MLVIYLFVACIFITSPVSADQGPKKPGQYVDRKYKSNHLVTIATPNTCKSEIRMELLIGKDDIVQPVIYCLDDKELPAAFHYDKDGFKYFLSEVFRLEKENTDLNIEGQKNPGKQ